MSLFEKQLAPADAPPGAPPKSENKSVNAMADHGDVEFQPLFPMTAEQEEANEIVQRAMYALVEMCEGRQLSNSMWSDENYNARMEHEKSLPEKATPSHQSPVRTTKLSTTVTPSSSVVPASDTSANALVKAAGPRPRPCPSWFSQQPASYVPPHLRRPGLAASTAIPVSQPTSPPGISREIDPSSHRIQTRARHCAGDARPGDESQPTCPNRMSATVSASAPRSPSTPPPSLPKAQLVSVPAVFAPRIRSAAPRNSDAMPSANPSTLPSTSRLPATTATLVPRSDSLSTSPSPSATILVLTPPLSTPPTCSLSIAAPTLVQSASLHGQQTTTSPSDYVLPHLRHRPDTTTFQTQTAAGKLSEVIVAEVKVATQIESHLQPLTVESEKAVAAEPVTAEIASAPRVLPKHLLVAEPKFGVTPPMQTHDQPTSIDSEKKTIAIAPTTYVLPHLRSAENTTTKGRPGKPAGTEAAAHAPPHLRGGAPFQLAETPAQTTVNLKMASAESVPSHLRSANYVPPHLQERSAQCQSLPPHLRGAVMANTPSSVTPLKVESAAIPLVSAATSVQCAARLSEDMDRDAFMQWLNTKKGPSNVVIKTENPVPIKSEIVPSYPVQHLQMSVDSSSLKEAVIKTETSSRQEREATEAAVFLKAMATRTSRNDYGAPKQTHNPAPLHSMGDRINNPFAKPRFHLKEDSTQTFQNFLEVGVDAPTSGQKWIDATVVNAQQVQPIDISSETPLARVVELTENRIPVVKVDVISQQAMFNAEFMTPNAPALLADITKADACPNVKAEASLTSSGMKFQPEIIVNTAPLTQDALVKTTGFKTAEERGNLDARISATGVGSVPHSQALRPPLRSQDMRALRGNDSSGLVDWDGGWTPGPCDWADRGTFDGSFVPDFIRDWQTSVPSGASVLVDVKTPGFLDGTCPVSNDRLIEPVIHDGPTFPDMDGAEDNMKRLYQTAHIEAHNFHVTWEHLANMPEEPNPFAPEIDIYLRPVEFKDAANLAVIYNHYVMNSTIPEDQEKITAENMSEIIRVIKQEKLPFIVAVKGRMPTPNDAQGRQGSKKVIMPAIESVIGFAFSEPFNYGFTALRMGRSRATLSLQLYVHPDYTRKGVGSNLLDRLIHCITPSYAYKNACGWINLAEDKVNESGGSGTFHQLLFQIPVEQRHDPNIGWLSRFLEKFHIREDKRLKSLCRSSVRGNQAHFMDMALFQYEANQEAQFDPFQ